MRRPFKTVEPIPELLRPTETCYGVRDSSGLIVTESEQLRCGKPALFYSTVTRLPYCQDHADQLQKMTSEQTIKAL